MKNPYILPKTIKPIKYNIELTPNFNDLNFSGKEIIELNIIKNTNEIILNSRDLEITSAKINDIKVKKIIYDKEHQQVKLLFNELKKGILSLELEFKGKVSQDMRGLYKSIYINDNKEKIMLTTQFEPNDARKCFPCFDEPNLKAKFNLTLKIPKELDAVSNMPVKRKFENNNLKTIIFDETPVMSTYLLAFVISELEYVEGKTKDNVMVRVLTTPGKKDKAKFPLEVAIKSLEFYINYFKIDYPLPKLDLIAIPDFESGAMENWGLITYREVALLYDEKNSSAGIKQSIVHTINHELAHQWFGNLVTMKWWNDLWLNEGFASWIEYKATDKLFPEFDIWNQYLTDVKISALYLDSLQNSHPIEVNVINPDEINEIFDVISYNKGSSIIMMLENYLGEEVFRNGLKFYLNKFKYGNAETDNLWDSLEEVSKKPVKKMMHSWTRQTGYPIISVSFEKDNLILKQERFSYLNKKSNEIWKIPINIYEEGKINCYLMDKKILKIKIKNNFFLNYDQFGFYRIRYDEKTFNKIISSKLNIKNKIGIINDTYSLSRGCYIPLKDFLNLIKNYKNETDYAIWDEISSGLGKIQLLFKEKHLEKINKFTRELFFEIHKKLGWEEKNNEGGAQVLATLGFSEDKNILNKARKMFDEHLKNKINPNLRSVVYNLAAFNDGIKMFNKLKEMYLKENLQEEKIRLLVSLGVFKEKEILREALKFSLSNKVKNQDTPYLLSVIGSNEYADDLAWNFFKDNWKEYYKRFHDGHTMPNLIKSVTMRFSSSERLNEIKEFFNKNKAENAKRAIEQSLEMIKINNNLVEFNKDLGI